jgi:NCS2 family nucleobase:cation symporter-2
MFVNGIELIGSRVLDKRRTMVVGTAIIAATSQRAVPELADAMPLVLQPLTSSGLALGMTIAVVLNLLFRIGIRRSASLTLVEPAGRLDAVRRFLSDEAGRWALRQDVLDHALMAVGDILRDKPSEREQFRRLTLDAHYDELRLTLLLRSTTDRLVPIETSLSSQPRRWIPAQVPGADTAAIQHRPDMTCLRMDFDV